MSDWNIIQDKEYCRNRIKMDKTERYKYCCIIIGNSKGIAYRFAPCSYEGCPIREEEGKK